MCLGQVARSTPAANLLRLSTKCSCLTSRFAEQSVVGFFLFSDKEELWKLPLCAQTARVLLFFHFFNELCGQVNIIRKLTNNMKLEKHESRKGYNPLYCLFHYIPLQSGEQLHHSTPVEGDRTLCQSTNQL